MGFFNTMLDDARRNKDLKLMGAIYKGNPDSSSVKFEYAKLLLYYGRRVKAEELFLELLNTKMEDKAMLELGKMEKSSGNYEQAKVYFEALAEKQYRPGTFQLAKLIAFLGDVEGAKKMLKSIISNDPNNFARIELGKLEAGQGNIEEARRYYKEAIKYQKQTAGRIAMGKLERSLGNVEEARKIFDHVANVEKDLSGKFERASLEFSVGNISLAREILTELYNVNKILSAGIELGKLEFLDGNIETAVNQLLMLKDTKLERLAYFYIISIYINLNNYYVAFKYAKEAVDRGNFIDAWLLIDIGKKLNVYFDIDYREYSYNYAHNQLLDYDPYLAIEHIMERHSSAPFPDFRSDIDVYKLFNDIKLQLTDDKKLRVISNKDNYLIPASNISYNSSNCLRVVTLPNSKDIITMYPEYSHRVSLYDSEMVDEESDYCKKLILK